MLLTVNEMVELVGPYTAAGCLAEYWSTSVEDRRSFYVILFYFILFYLFLFVYLNSPADHLAHRRGPPVCRGPQVGKRWCRGISFRFSAHTASYSWVLQLTFKRYSLEASSLCQGKSMDSTHYKIGQNRHLLNPYVLNIHQYLGFEVQTAVKTSIMVFLAVTPCSLASCYDVSEKHKIFPRKLTP
jgi:hypothetical protein